MLAIKVSRKFHWFVSCQLAKAMHCAKGQGEGTALDDLREILSALEIPETLRTMDVIEVLSDLPVVLR